MTPELQEEIQNATLAELGIILMDSVDGALVRRNYEDLNKAYQNIGQEIVRRIPDTTKIRPMMDFHYKKWADLQEKGPDKSQPKEAYWLQNAFYEFRAMMAGFAEAAPKEENNENQSTLHGRC